MIQHNLSLVLKEEVMIKELYTVEFHRRSRSHSCVCILEYAYITIRDAHAPLQQGPNLHLQIETTKKSNIKKKK